MMRELYGLFNIKHLNLVIYQFEMNEVVEVINKNIKKITEKMIVTHKGWSDLPPLTLLAYRILI